MCAMFLKQGYSPSTSTWQMWSTTINGAARVISMCMLDCYYISQIWLRLHMLMAHLPSSKTFRHYNLLYFAQSQVFINQAKWAYKLVCSLTGWKTCCAYKLTDFFLCAARCDERLQNIAYTWQIWAFSTSYKLYSWGIIFFSGWLSWLIHFCWRVRITIIVIFTQK